MDWFARAARSIWAFFMDRITQAGEVPPLAGIIRDCPGCSAGAGQGRYLRTLIIMINKNITLAILTEGKNRPTFFPVLQKLVECNRDLSISLVLYHVGSSRLEIPSCAYGYFKNIEIIKNHQHLFPYLENEWQRKYLDSINTMLDGTAKWRNILLLYSYIKKLDVLIFWDDDQYPIWEDQTKPFFIPLLAGLEEHVVSSARRFGYINRYPLSLCNYIPHDILEILENVLVICNEVCFPSMFRESFSNFMLPLQKWDSSKWVNGKWISSGETAYKLENNILPAFFQPLKSRGEDTFFSIKFNGESKIFRSTCSYFHDPYNTLREFHSSTINWNKITPLVSEQMTLNCFYKIVNGWLSYGPLFVRLEFPDWEKQLYDMKDKLRSISNFNYAFFNSFNNACIRLNEDLQHYNNIHHKWEDLVHSVTL